MGKFKVDDKVRFTSGYAKSIGNLVGLEGIVIGYTKDDNLGVLLSTGHTVPAAEEELEKVVPEMLQEYEVGKPYLWFGGDCPVPEGTKIEFRTGRNDFSQINRFWAISNEPERLMWYHGDALEVADILMFKVVEYPKQTRKVELELSEEEITTIKEVLEKLNT